MFSYDKPDPSQISGHSALVEFLLGISQCIRVELLTTNIAIAPNMMHILNCMVPGILRTAAAVERFLFLKFCAIDSM